MEVIYKPSKWGQEFHDLTVDEALGAGSAGPGKSTVLRAMPLQRMAIEEARVARDPRIAGVTEAHPLWSWIKKNPLRPGESQGWGLHLRRQAKDLLQTIEKSRTLYNRVFPSIRWDGKNNMFVCPSGYKLQFGHCQHTSDYEDYLSQEYDLILFDELVQFEQEQYEQITARLRSSDPILRRMLYVRSMSNPVMRREAGENFSVHNPHWVRDRFVKPARNGRTVLWEEATVRGRKVRRSRIYLPAKLTDNPDQDFVEFYEGTLALKPTHIRRALLDGDWFVVAGSFFEDSWEEKIHLVEPFTVPRSWKFFRSLDWGFRAEGDVQWHAVSPEGKGYTIRQYRFRGQDAEQMAKTIREIELRMGLWVGSESTITGPADDQLWEERGDVAESKAATFERLGVYWVKADKRSRSDAARRCTVRLKNSLSGDSPGWYVFNTCRKLAETIPSLQTDPHDPEVPVKGGDDHSYDCWSYGVTYAQQGYQQLAGLHDAWDDYRNAVEIGGSTGYGDF